MVSETFEHPGGRCRHPNQVHGIPRGDQRRVEAYTIHPNAITTVEFIEFVEMLSAKFLGQEFAIFMDNLQVPGDKDQGGP